MEGVKVFEQKKTKQDEQKIVSSFIESPEVGENQPHLIIEPHNFCTPYAALKRFAAALCCFHNPKKPRRSPWMSYNVVTLSNNWPNYGNAVPETFIFLLKTSDLHAFVLVEEKAVFALKKNMLSPLKMLTK
ncbi:MAG: hypothetical protein CMM94_05395 [Rickettsiales bacterium]|nr:hypothetical protein [Rickettsiales bacterium]|tara:strand:- start:569 stop:961 length:393 start_codon:yes stop_codon:yes gene_type:complete